MFFFFFSSRRRHTICGRDWSLDVCSSDLQQSAARGYATMFSNTLGDNATEAAGIEVMLEHRVAGIIFRSEERRVGKEGKFRWRPGHKKKKQYRREHQRNTNTTQVQ